MKKHRFTATIIDAGGGGAYVEVPFDVEAAFGSKRPKVRARIDGAEYRGTLVRMGGPCHLLLILKDIRAAIGKQPGDTVDVAVEADLEPRVVDIPPDALAALRRVKGALAAFEALSYTHRKEHVAAILAAKRPETRAARIARMVEMLRTAPRRAT